VFLFLSRESKKLIRTPNSAARANADLNHNEQWYVEAAEGRVDLVEKVLADGAVGRPGLGVGVLVPYDQQGRQADAGRSQPNQEHVEDHPTRRPLHPVLQRLRDGPVPWTESRRIEGVAGEWSVYVRADQTAAEWETRGVGDAG